MFSFNEIIGEVARQVPERSAVVRGQRSLSYRDFVERTDRFAAALVAHGFGSVVDRSALAGHQSGQDHLAIYLHNSIEYLEAMSGALRARVAPLNVNYRYVHDELVGLLQDAAARVLVFGRTFSPIVAEIRGRLPLLELLVVVEDGSGERVPDDVVEFEFMMADGDPAGPAARPSVDDLFIIYTGGTTGMPKGVLWTVGDVLRGGLVEQATGGELSLEHFVASVVPEHPRTLVTAPLMHGAAMWSSLTHLGRAGTVVMPQSTMRFDPDGILDVAERQRCTTMSMVGDAFAGPLLDAMDRRPIDMSALTTIVTGGAALSTRSREALLERLPQVSIVDAVGATETGAQGIARSSSIQRVESGCFAPLPGMAILDDTRTRILHPDSAEIGWLAQTGSLPLGYLNDEAKTADTFVVVDEERYAVPGDLARWRDAQLFELLGRESTTINSGGEKIFAEEVEAALKRHASIDDAVVIGAPSERFGSEVCAIVSVRSGHSLDPDELRSATGRHLASYKLPRQIIVRATVVRTPSGKVDRAWAFQQLDEERVRAGSGSKTA